MAAGALAWLLRSDEPPEVDAERALEQVPDADAEPVAAPDDETSEVDEEVDDGPDTPAGHDAGVSIETGGFTDAGTVEDLTGTWTIDPERDFDRAEGEGSFVGYRVREELSTIGDNVAVGRSPAVDATVQIEGLTVTSVAVSADLGELESDDGRRDGRVRSTLGPDASATFELDTPIELPEVPPVGEVVELSTSGTITIAEVSAVRSVDLQAAVVSPELMVVVGSTTVVLSDHGIEAPSAPILLSVSDEATIEWQLFLARTS